MPEPSPATDPGHDALGDPVLGEPRLYTADQVAGAAGVSTERAHAYLRAMGYAATADTEIEFTESDAAALRMLAGYVNEGLLTERSEIQLTRLLGRTVARLVESQVEVVVSRLEEAGIGAEERIDYARQLAHRVMPDVRWLLGYTWRRQMAAAIHRLNPAVADAQPAVLGVGFADMVGFTNLSRKLPDAGLMSLVERFEDYAAEVVTENGGRIVKMLGDEVLFTADEPGSVAEIGTRLAIGCDRDPDMPGLRVGLSLGPVVRHFGDIFGTTVNLASRLTALAEPSTVLVAPALATALAGNPAFELKPAGVRYVRGIGPTDLSVLGCSQP